MNNEIVLYSCPILFFIIPFSNLLRLRLIKYKLKKN